MPDKRYINSMNTFHNQHASIPTLLESLVVKALCHCLMFSPCVFSRSLSARRLLLYRLGRCLRHSQGRPRFNGNGSTISGTVDEEYYSCRHGRCAGNLRSDCRCHSEWKILQARRQWIRYLLAIQCFWTFGGRAVCRTLFVGIRTSNWYRCRCWNTSRRCTVGHGGILEENGIYRRFRRTGQQPR